MNIEQEFYNLLNKEAIEKNANSNKFNLVLEHLIKAASKLEALEDFESAETVTKLIEIVSKNV